MLPTPRIHAGLSYSVASGGASDAGRDVNQSSRRPCLPTTSRCRVTKFRRRRPGSPRHRCRRRRSPIVPGRCGASVAGRRPSRTPSSRPSTTPSVRRRRDLGPRDGVGHCGDRDVDDGVGRRRVRAAGARLHGPRFALCRLYSTFITQHPSQVKF